jgi:hypothetical protein
MSIGIDSGDLAPLVTDISVLCGFRDQKEQDEAFKNGASKKRWPDSMHNVLPSMAVDVVPYPVDWGDMKRFVALRTYALGVARGLGIKIRVISWDWPHYELA